MKTAFEDLRDFVAEMLGGSARSELTIASGAILPPDGSGGGIHTVDTESNAASDDLNTATQTNTPEGRILILMAENTSRVVTIKHGAGGAGEFLHVDSADFVLDTSDKWIAYQRRSTDWVEFDRGYGASYYDRHDFERVPMVPAHTMLCGHKRLAIAYASAATITITADEVVLADTDGHLRKFSSLSETLTISSTGANGRDVSDNAGAEQASVWYHLFAIAKEDGTLDTFASQVGYPGSGTSIYSRLPSGYTWAGYIGAAYNDGSSNLLNFKQAGDEVEFAARAFVSSGTQTTFTSASLAAVVPVTARAVSGWMQISIAAAFQSGQATLQADSSAGFGAQLLWAGIATSVPAVGNFRTLLATAQTLYYKVNSSSVLFDAAATGFRF